MLPVFLDETGQENSRVRVKRLGFGVGGESDGIRRGAGRTQNRIEKAADYSIAQEILPISDARKVSPL